MTDFFPQWASNYIEKQQEQLRTLIIQSGMSQVDIAIKAGYSEESLSKFMNKRSDLNGINILSTVLVVGTSYEDFHRQVAEQTERPND